MQRSTTFRFITRLVLCLALLVLALPAGDSGQPRGQWVTVLLPPPPPVQPYSEPVVELIAVELRAAADAWLEVEADGEPPKTKLLRAGHREIRQVETHLKLRIGNAGAVQAFVNGKSLGRLGARGQTRVLEFGTPPATIVAAQISERASS